MSPQDLPVSSQSAQGCGAPVERQDEDSRRTPLCANFPDVPELRPTPYLPYIADSLTLPYAPARARVRDRYWLHALLFLITLLTTTMVGTALEYDFDRNIPFNVEHTLDAYIRVWHHPIALLQGLPFSLTLITILLAHELGTTWLRFITA